MPAFAEVAGISAVTDFTAMQAVVQPTQGGNFWSYAEVLEVKKSAGLIPGKAVISVRNTTSTDETTQITLDNNNGLDAKLLKYWSRINITQNGLTIFTGALMKRRDSIAGNAIVLEYWDDRWLLQGIPLRGCIVYDPYDSTVKLIPRLMPHPNPKGYRNCTRVNDDTYVFIVPAERGTQTLEYDQNIGTKDEGSAPGTAIYWTPERWLKYLRYYATIFTVTGTPYAGNFASLDTTKLQWPAFTFQAFTPQNTTTASQPGLMQGKMPDMDFKGMTVFGAIDRTLKMTGFYDFTVDYTAGYLRAFATAKGVLNSNTATAGKTLNLLRSGSTLDMKSVVDGVAETDASGWKSAGLTEGAPFRIEAQFWYSNASTTDPDTGFGDSLIPAWTSAEQTKFLQIISTGKDLNGTDIPGGSTGSLRNTTQAVQVARACFPKPFRAFQIYDPNGTNLASILNGVNNALSAYPVVNQVRTPLPEQLTPYFEDVNTTTPSQRGRLRIPIRIQVSDVDSSTASPKFHDVTYNNGLRITNDGLIWLDGLTDDIAVLDAIYTNTLVGYNGTAGTLPKLKYMKINMAVEHDARLWAQYDMFFDGTDPNNVGDQIDPSLAGSATKGPYLQHYVLNQEGFLHESLVKSLPVLPGSFTTSDGGSPPALVSITPPISKVIYNNNPSVFDHSQRTQTDNCAFKRSSTFEFPGIRADLDVGDYIDKITYQPNGGDFKINAPIMEVTYDFKNQRTKVRME